MRTEDDIRAALTTLAPDPATDGPVLAAMQATIARRRTARRAAAVAAAATAVAASLVLSLLPAGGKQHSGHSPGERQPIVSAAVYLRALAKVAEAQPAFKPPGPGQYFYYAQTGLDELCFKPANPHDGYGYFDNCSIRVRYLTQSQTWVAPDGSGRALNTTIKATFPSARDRAHWIAAGRPKLNQASGDLRYGKGKLVIGLPGLSKLPTNPKKLAAVIASRRFEGGGPGDQETFTQVTDLLSALNASPALRAAAFEVGARIPGVKSLGVVPAHGVKGVGIAFTARLPKLPKYKGEHTVTEVIFNRATSTLKAEINLLIKHGKVIDTSWETWGATGLVNSVTSVP